MMLLELAESERDVAEALRRDPEKQREMCDPRFNPNAAAFFIFNYCLTQDEDRGGMIGPLPDPTGRGKFALDYLEELDQARVTPYNIHDEKPRRLLHTWINCHYNLWSLMWVRGYSALLISRSEDHVDDGGKHERTFSMFSRMRFAYERLPQHVRKHISWQHMAGSCAENEAYVMGRAPTRDAGRGAGTVRAFVEECEFIEWMQQIHAALDPACKHGKVYSGSVNGTANVVAQLKKDQREGWKFLEWNWWDDPAHCEGIRETTPVERERYGRYISNWFVSATASLDDEDIAQEYLRDRQRSTKAVCVHQYRKDVHVITRPRRLAYNPDLPLWVGLDFGKHRKTAAAIGQPVGDRKLHVIADFEGTHKTTPEIARALVAKVMEVAPGLPIKDAVLIPDPSGLIGEQSSDIALLEFYLKAGFSRWELPVLRGNGSVKLGIQVLNVAFQQHEIEIDESCGIIIEALPNYRWPIDRITREVKRDADPIHGMESHICDALRYLAVNVFPIVRSGAAYDTFSPLIAPGQNGDRSVIDHDPDLGDDTTVWNPGMMRHGSRFDAAAGGY
jgi:hypothetical protein